MHDHSKGMVDGSTRSTERNKFELSLLEQGVFLPFPALDIHDSTMRVVDRGFPREKMTCYENDPMGPALTSTYPS